MTGWPDDQPLSKADVVTVETAAGQFYKRLDESHELEWLDGTEMPMLARLAGRVKGLREIMPALSESFDKARAAKAQARRHAPTHTRPSASPHDHSHCSLLADGGQAEDASRMAKELLEGPQAEIERDLEAAQPALVAAVAAANTVTPADFKEFKGMKAPPAGCAEVMLCVMMYLGELPPTAKADWQGMKKLMGPDFMSKVLNFDKDGISDKVRFPVPPLSKSPIPS